LLVSMPAVSGLRWGTLAAAFDQGPLEARLLWSRRILVGVSLGFAGLLALVLYLGLSRLVVQPLQTLAQAAAAIEAGQLGARAQVQRGDELGQLAAAFNRMADQIQSQTESLERKVAERSAEVERKADELGRVNRQLQAAALELQRLARVDGLTGVFNRRHFGEVIEACAPLREASQPAPAPVTLVMVDVDHFKRCNDRFGHPAGDTVLREVARLLGAALRPSDILARYGGEEFAVILPATPQAEGLEIAERLRVAIGLHDFSAAVGQPIGPLTVSLGVATYPEDATASAGLVARADEALYAAKHGGRNQVRAAPATA